MAVESLHEHPAPYVLDLSGADIPGEADRLRGMGDVVAVEMPGGIRAWTPTRHRLVEDLLTDPRVSRDPRLHWDAWNNGWLEANPAAQWITGLMGENMFTTYGAEAARLRKLVAPAFTGRRVKAMQPIIDRITTELLDDLATAAPGEVVDLRARFAHPLPMRLICELFDVDDEGGAAVKGFVEKVLTTGAPAHEAIAAVTAARETFTQLLARKRQNPGEDLTSALITAQDGDDRLSDAEIMDTLLLVIGAGHETTVHLLGNAIVALLQHPEQLAAVREGKVTWEAVVEETLRWASSSAMTPLRFAVEDITVGEVTIRAGEAILAPFGHVGWDPEQHGEDAHVFDVTRTPTKHMAFGHGVHRCLGAALARAESLSALPTLFERYPNLALAEGEEPTRIPSFILYGYRDVKVTLAP